MPATGVPPNWECTVGCAEQAAPPAALVSHRRVTHSRIRLSVASDSFRNAASTALLPLPPSSPPGPMPSPSPDAPLAAAAVVAAEVAVPPKGRRAHAPIGPAEAEPPSPEPSCCRSPASAAAFLLCSSSWRCRSATFLRSCSARNARSRAASSSCGGGSNVHQR